MPIGTHWSNHGFPRSSSSDTIFIRDAAKPHKEVSITCDAGKKVEGSGFYGPSRSIEMRWKRVWLYGVTRRGDKKRAIKLGPSKVVALIETGLLLDAGLG